MEEQVVETFTISNKLGLHARAASHFVQVASKFESEVFVTKNDQEVNGKSIMGILILAAPMGAEISIKAVGPDASQAVVALGELIDNRFGED